MRSTWISLACCAAVAAAVLGGNSAEARPPYLAAFKESYSNLADKAGEAKCTICHFGESKKNNNDYGTAMKTALGAKNVKEAEAIKASLKKIETEKSSTEGKTFGDLIKAGELPGKNPA
ncbi:MAG: hypothetical protein C0478_09525 [Planctomyces sp.]|nr:hypothetical protein [Planctomyces sp.]